MPLQAQGAPPRCTIQSPPMEHRRAPSGQPRTSACCVHQQAPSIIKVSGPGRPRLIIGALCWPASDLVPVECFHDHNLHLQGGAVLASGRAQFQLILCPESPRTGCNSLAWPAEGAARLAEPAPAG
jgi:hypothetical protein